MALNNGSGAVISQRRSGPSAIKTRHDRGLPARRRAGVHGGNSTKERSRFYSATQSGCLCVLRTSCGPDGRLDAIGHLGGVFVLQARITVQPASASRKSTLRSGRRCDRSRQPIVGVALRLLVVLGAAVPPAAVYEDRDLRAGEDDVGGVPGARQPVVDPVAEAAGTQDRPQGELGPGVPAAVPCMLRRNPGATSAMRSAYSSRVHRPR